MLLSFEVRVSGHAPLSGEWELKAGENRLVLSLPDGIPVPE